MRVPVCSAFAMLTISGTQAAELAVRISEPPTPALTRSDHLLAGLAEHAPFVAARRANDLPLLGPERPTPGAAAAGFSIGPLHADMVTRISARTGKARLVPHYRLDGITVFGGSIGGSIDTRGGMVTLNWHTGP